MNPAFKVLHESGGEYKQSVFNVAYYKCRCESQSELILQRYMRLILLGIQISPLYRDPSHWIRSLLSITSS